MCSDVRNNSSRSTSETRQLDLNEAELHALVRSPVASGELQDTLFRNGRDGA